MHIMVITAIMRRPAPAPVVRSLRKTRRYLGGLRRLPSRGAAPWDSRV
jgi:hypothetical protein